MIYNCNSANGFSLTAFCSAHSFVPLFLCSILLLSLMARAIFNFGMALAYVCVCAMMLDIAVYLCTKYFPRSSSTQNYCAIAHKCISKQEKNWTFFFSIFVFHSTALQCRQYYVGVSRIKQHNNRNGMRKKNPQDMFILCVHCIFLASFYAESWKKWIISKRRKTAVQKLVLKMSFLLSWCWESHLTRPII